MSDHFFSIKPEFFEKILNSLNVGIYIADKNGTTLWMNKTSERELKKPRDEMIGRNVAELEQNGVYKPSAMNIALQANKQTVTTIQQIASRKVLVTANLIYNDQQEVEYLVTHGIDMFNDDIRNSQTLELDDIQSLLRRYLDELRSIALLNKTTSERDQPFVGRSESFTKLSQLISKIAAVDTTVLISGETGVGKTVFAQQIHTASERFDKPFVHINCAAIPESLLESELFGYQKGAFTGAKATGKPGLVKQAEQGTLFLDEISELPLHLQSKLLQLLQNKTYMPIGSLQAEKADVRIIAASNCNLEDLVKSGKFRSDLFYRLNILPVKIPALRERKDDIFPLLYFHLEKFNARHQKKRTFSAKAVEALQNYAWPGNIRELENMVEQLVILAAEDTITIDDLPTHIVDTEQKDANLYTIPAGSTLTEIVQDVEKRTIELAYRKHRSTRKAASSLGITHSSLVRRLAKYQIAKDAED